MKDEEKSDKFKHTTWATQEAIRDIENWLQYSGLSPLTSCYTNQNDDEFSKEVLVELLESYPKLMIDYLHGCNQPSRTLAGALAHLIMISIRIPMNAKQTYLALANLLCVSNDSFIFDFVLVCLGTRKTLGLSSSFSKRITKYIFFLQSNSPEYKRKEDVY